MNPELLLFQSAFLLISMITLLAVHRYINAKLERSHDNGLVWIACALGVWLMLGLHELYWNDIPAGERPARYWYSRKILSIINSAFFIYSLSYFKEGWIDLHKVLSRVNLSWVVGVTVGLCLISFPVPPAYWVVVDTCISIAVAGALYGSISVIFWQRGIHLMVFVGVLGGLMLISTQVIELSKDGLLGNTDSIAFWKDQILDDVIRIASRPILVVSVLVLAITWLGSQLEEELVTRLRPKDQKSGASQLVFEERGERKFVTLTLVAGKCAVERLVVDFTRAKAPYLFLKRCARNNKAGKPFHRNDFTDNLEVEIKRVLRPINAKLQQNGQTFRLTKTDIFTSDTRGYYRLAFDDIEGDV